MSGYRSSSFRHDCGKHGCYNDQLPDWDWMMDCFPRGIIPTDVDGVVEINRQFLFIEQKREGAPIPEGQRQAYKRLAEEPNKTVLFLRSTDSEDHYQCLVFGAGEPQGWQRWDRGFIRAWLLDWVATAEGTEAA